MIKLLSIKDSSCGASTDLGLPEPGVSTKVVSTKLKVWALLLLLLLKAMEKEKEHMQCISIPPIDLLFALSQIQINWPMGGKCAECYGVSRAVRSFP